MRFPPIKPADMTPEQRELAASYRTGWRTGIANPDGSLGGPFDATLRSPGLASRLAGVSNYFRDGTALPRRLNEFAILVVARQWNSAFEWHAHCASAIEAGLDVQVAQDLSNGKRPAAMKDDEALVYDAAMEGVDLFSLSKVTVGDRALA